MVLIAPTHTNSNQSRAVNRVPDHQGCRSCRIGRSHALQSGPTVTNMPLNLRHLAIALTLLGLFGLLIAAPVALAGPGCPDKPGVCPPG